jgi:hypothetical protein
MNLVDIIRIDPLIAFFLFWAVVFALVLIVIPVFLELRHHFRRWRMTRVKQESSRHAHVDVAGPFLQPDGPVANPETSTSLSPRQLKVVRNRRDDQAEFSERSGYQGTTITMIKQ